ncbi:MAG TPA: CheR family methyltransferase [Thermoanaerobaculia bacterium]|nr:CheR family methyltransferase [Thermoanaerobaculia bacterium]
MTDESGTSEFPRLLEYLKQTRGFEFSAHKVSTLMRRIQKRMREVGVDSYPAYTDYLEVHPQEFGPLFDTVLINVTSFFRDSPSWDYLAEHIVPRILEEKGADLPIRIWSAGCASGEEAYSLAILMAEAVGDEEFRRRVKIYATDADEGALAAARQGSFEARQMEGVSPERVEKYFDKAGSRFNFRNELRRCIIFGRHDLIQDAAISRLDLLVCRNTLMYFNSEAQARILTRFHFALNRTGYLYLGKAETLLSHNSNFFKPVELKHRIFTRSATSNMRDRLLALSSGTGLGDTLDAGARNLRLREMAFDASPVAQVAIDYRGYLTMVSERARRLFNLGTGDLGRPLQDLEISYRPVELRSHLERAYELRGPVVIKDVEWRGSGDAAPRQLEVQVLPLIDGKGTILGATVAFLDLTQSHQLRSELERANQELETAYEELQSANEELETTNEELQSTVEELETTNEELQSANEELETMNEELQSTNEELRNLNDQLQSRGEELNDVNGYFESVLTGLRAGVAVLDRDLRVRVWSEKAEDFWGLRSDEVRGQSFPGLDIGLPVRDLQEVLRQSLREDGQREQILDGVNRRGKPIRCRVRVAPQTGPQGIDGLILLMEEVGA